MDRNTKKQAALDAIFADDPMDLLAIKPASVAQRTADERLDSAFQDIQDFWGKHRRLPSPDGGVQEYQLFSRLKNIQNDPQKAGALREADQYGLLEMLPPDMLQEPDNQTYKTKSIDSLDDIFADDSFKSLEDETADVLFDLKHVGPPVERAEADFVARRKPCPDFKNFEPRFKAVQKDLAEGKRRLLPFTERNLRAGHFYVHNGILLLLEWAEIEQKMVAYDSGERVRKDGRTRVVFENGTESNMLFRSLYKALLENGKAVSDNEDAVAGQLAENFNAITDEDQATGFIYVLKSKSGNPEITAIRDLYKIGYSTTPVEERIKNAAQEPTYLMAEVALVSVFRCFNLNPQRFEQLLHGFFGEACLNVDVFDEKGRRHTPREWFVAPLPVIERAVRLLVSGEIVGARYDALSGKIVAR